MCEFTVYLLEDNSESKTEIAKEIFAAMSKDGDTLLMNITGNAQIVKGAFIEEVSTLKQELILRRTPYI